MSGILDSEVTNFAISDSEAVWPSSAIFEARLDPQGSLSRLGFSAVIAAVTLTTALLVTVLILLHLWAIVPFSLLAASLMTLALWINQRDLSRTEHLHIDPSGVTITVGRPSKPLSVHRLPLYGLTLERDIDPDYGVRALRLSLRGSGLEIAGQLAPCQRAALADRLETAFRDAHCNLWRRNRIIAAGQYAPLRNGC